MGLTLELPAELATTLQEEAAERGLSLDAYAIEVLSRSRTDSSSVRTGEELVRYWQQNGLLGLRPEITDSSEHARRIREQSQTRS